MRYNILKVNTPTYTEDEKTIVMRPFQWERLSDEEDQTAFEDAVATLLLEAFEKHYPEDTTIYIRQWPEVSYEDNIRRTGHISTRLAVEDGAIYETLKTLRKGEGK
jgi:hypothetical protein